MKKKISISLESEIDSAIEFRLTDSIFSSKSHMIEYAIKKFLREDNAR
jgi:Arc/MetJ-type ribon-helix-helix transcriptional regulator